MMTMRKAAVLVSTAVVVLAGTGAPGALAGAAGKAAADAATQAQARDILGRSVAFRTVKGQGQTVAYANYLAGLLRQAGFAEADITITPMGDTATFVARYRGTGKKKPILVSAHMDVVEAFPKDWERDPFTMTADNGYLFGRGVEDNKFDLSMVMATVLRLKREGFKPSRDIVLVFSGDEETEMKTTRALATQFPDAELLLNSDGGGGSLAEDGKPIGYYLQAAEKTYADFAITVTNPGGHSSVPRKDNAIYELAQAIDRIAAYEFPVQASELTRASFRATARNTPGDLGAAMTRFADNPDDKQAVATIAAHPEYVGQLRTTCVATMLSGGHALNALPQSATVSVNCRIFPGVAVESVRQTLAQVIANPAAKVVTLDDPTASDASPLRKDVTAAVRKAVDRVYPGLNIIPSMSSGATDSLHFRAAGIPSYGVSGLYAKASDGYAHGLNERVAEAALAPALDHWHTVLTELAK